MDMMNNAHKLLYKLIGHLGRLRQPGLIRARAHQESADTSTLSSVQNATARAARKNPWILAG
jgi:hypothetical protein